MKYGDVLIRALKTFLQGFLASIVISLQNPQDMNEELLKAMLLGAVASGFSAVMNLIINYLDKEEKNDDVN